MELDLDELRATYDHPSDKSIIEVIDRLEQVTQELAGYKTREALSLPIDFESLERAIKAEQAVASNRTALVAIQELHKSVPCEPDCCDEGLCGTCYDTYPCPTRKLADEALNN